MSLFSVIVPVYNRRAELRRALQSIADQEFTNFECIVVDDASTEPIKPVVDEFDERFVYVRREANSGCATARLTGCQYVRGDLVAFLDSDNEFFPWTLARAARYLENYPEVGGAAGLYLFPEGFRVRIPGKKQIVGAEYYAGRSSRLAGSDMVWVVRQAVTRAWLRDLQQDYVSLDFVFVLHLLMSYRVVMVDEPWGRYDTTSSNRVSTGGDPRECDDAMKFIRDFRPLLGASPCGPVDVWLIGAWVRLHRARRHREAAAVADWMRERGISRITAARRKVAWRLESLIPLARPSVYMSSYTGWNGVGVDPALLRPAEQKSGRAANASTSDAP